MFRGDPTVLGVTNRSFAAPDASSFPLGDRVGWCLCEGASACPDWMHGEIENVKGAKPNVGDDGGREVITGGGGTARATVVCRTLQNILDVVGGATVDNRT